ncbi:MAG: stage 0 sporulation protein, partial [Desulfobacterales bacterium]
MPKVVGVRFKQAGKVYDFDCGAFVLHPGDHVIVETEQGLGLGTVAVPPSAREESADDKQLKKIYRLATEKDLIQLEQNLESEKAAHAFCLQCIRQLGLKMNLFAVDKSFDQRKITFFFTSEGRVDF